MARIRSIHPGIFTDEAFMSASAHARLLIIGIWCEAWDDGVFEWKPLTLKARLFPVDAVDLPALLAELTDLEFVTRFDHAGKSYGAIRNFGKFQRPKKPNSSGVLPSTLQSYVAVEISSEPVPNQFRTSPEKSPQMEDGGGKREEEEKQGSDADASAQAKPAHPESAVDRIWTRHLFDLVSLSGKPEPTVRRWIGKVLASHDAEPVERAMLAAIAAKTGDPFAYATRVLTPDPKARGSPSDRKPTVHDAAAALVEWTRTNEQHSEPPALRPMLTSVRS
jgi:hypothetical protein